MTPFFCANEFDKSYYSNLSKLSREIMNDELSKWNKPDTFELDSQRYLLDNIIEDLKHRVILDTVKRYEAERILLIKPIEVKQEVVHQDIISGEKTIRLTIRFEGEYYRDGKHDWLWEEECAYLNKFLDTEVVDSVFKKRATTPLLASSPDPTDNTEFYPVITPEKKKVRKIVQTYKSKPILNELTGNYVYLELLSYKEGQDE